MRLATLSGNRAQRESKVGSAPSSGSFPDGRRWVVLPDVLKRLGKRLLFHRSVHVSGIAGKYELVVIALGSEYLRRMLVGENPIVQVVAHHVWIEQIPVTNFHPDSYRLDGAFRDEMFVKLPGAVRRPRIVRPLLVYECSGIGENPVIKLGVIPSHDQGARAS